MNVDPSLLEQFPYLDITAEDLRALLDGDPVTRKGHAAIEDYRTKIADYEARRAAYQVELDRLADERTDLEAKLKANSTQTREVRGADASMKYHIQLATRRITERNTSLNKRQKFLFRMEVNRRLTRMGKEFKLGTGTRSAQGSGVVDLKTA